MPKTRKPIVVTTVLSAATLILVGGTVAAATLPSSGLLAAPTRDTSQVTPATPPTSTPATKIPTAVRATGLPVPPSAAKASPAPTHRKPKQRLAITYTVKPGDTLSDIAAWFKQHGYQSLYRANKAVIGSDPDLIRPGQRITVRNGVMTTEAPS